jgi:hypothetical protein
MQPERLAATAVALVLACGCGGAFDPSAPDASAPIRASWVSDASLDAAVGAPTDAGSVERMMARDGAGAHDGAAERGVGAHDGAGESDGSTESEAAPGPCPATVPDAGQGCTSPDGSFLECEYGGDAHGLCRTLARCAGQWTITQTTCASDPSICPPAYGGGEGSSCPISGPCDYAEGRCACVDCSLAADGGIEGGHWHCRAWLDAGPGCPPYSPLVGSVCSAPGGTACGSDCCGSPVLGEGVQCSGGIWRSLGCTISCVAGPSLGCR